MRVRQITTVVTLVLIAFGALAILWLKWRGFRASSSPSAVEIRAARFLRNFTMPRKERDLANPFANDDIATAQGRELFLPDALPAMGSTVGAAPQLEQTNIHASPICTPNSPNV